MTTTQQVVFFASLAATLPKSAVPNEPHRANKPPIALPAHLVLDSLIFSFLKTNPWCAKKKRDDAHR